MQTVFKYGSLFLIFVISLLIVMDINATSQRKTELNDSGQISSRNVLKANNINIMYEMSEDDLTVEYIRNLASNVNTDSDIRINVLDKNENGLLDVSLTTTFSHLNGVLDSRSTRKTMIVEEYEK